MDGTAQERPIWARRIRAERQARGWSQAAAVRALRGQGQSTGQGLAGQESLVREWKRWEAGRVEPDGYHKQLLAKTFGTVTAAIFPPPRDEPSELLAVTGMDTLEIVARLRMSDVSPATLEALAITADRLGCDYSHLPPEELHTESQAWLRRLTTLLDRRLTLTQHREVLTLAGQVALLVGCLEYDMGRRRPAETTRQAALSLGREAENAHVIGWAHEMRAWYALTQGQYRSAIAAADLGLAAAGPTHSVSVQLAAHRAKAWARIGDTREVTAALDQGRTLLEALPYPDNVDNHFVVDPGKWDFYTMDCYRHVGEDTLAETYAREVLRTAANADGTIIRPMRAAEARVTLGIVAARRSDLEAALTEGHLALAGDRRSVPSLAMNAGELVATLRRRYPGEPEVEDYADEVRALAAGTAS